jgi:hypothetical protein
MCLYARVSAFQLLERNTPLGFVVNGRSTAPNRYRFVIYSWLGSVSQQPSLLEKALQRLQAAQESNKQQNFPRAR